MDVVFHKNCSSQLIITTTVFITKVETTKKTPFKKTPIVKGKNKNTNLAIGSSNYRFT